MANIRILIADDHAVVRRGLRSLLESQPGWKVCAEAATGREAVEQAGRLKPDVRSEEHTSELQSTLESRMPSSA